MIRYYYFITPIYILLDSLMGWNLRIAGLADPGHRIFYYLFLLACGAGIWKLPRLTPLIALTESGVNFFLLIGSIMLPILGAGHLLENPAIGFTGWPQLVNFFVTGLILCKVFQSNVSRLSGPDPNR